MKQFEFNNSVNSFAKLSLQVKETMSSLCGTAIL